MDHHHKPKHLLKKILTTATIIILIGLFFHLNPQKNLSLSFLSPSMKAKKNQNDWHHYKKEELTSLKDTKSSTLPLAWESKLVQHLLEIALEGTQISIKTERNYGAMKQVLIAYQSPTAKTSYRALVDPHKAQIIKTWDRTILERNDPRDFPLGP